MEKEYECVLFLMDIDLIESDMQLVATCVTSHKNVLSEHEKSIYCYVKFKVPF